MAVSEDINRSNKITNTNNDKSNKTQSNNIPTDVIKKCYSTENYVQIIISLCVLIIGLYTSNWTVFIVSIIIILIIYFRNIYYYQCPLNTILYVDSDTTRLSNNKCSYNSTGYITTMELLLIIQCIFSIKGSLWLIKLNIPNIIDHLYRL